MSAPITRAQAILAAEAYASQVTTRVASSVNVPSQSGIAPLGNDQLMRNRVDFIDSWDSRWQRDPGRAAGPFS